MKHISKIMLLLICSTLAIDISARAAENCSSRNGEVIVKFKDASGVAIKRSAKGKYLTSQVSQVDVVLTDSLGVFDVDDLMPLSGQIVYPRKVRQSNGQMRGDRDMSRLCLVYYDTLKVENVDMAIAALEKLDAVEYAEPNYIVSAEGEKENPQKAKAGGANVTESSNDVDNTNYLSIYSQEPLYPQQWGPAVINLPWLWQQPIIHKKRPVIAIIDTGVDLTHPDLSANIWDNELEVNGIGGQDDDHNGYFDDIHGFDFIYNTGVITDRHGHGTHCAGIAAAIGNNEIGITGANPEARIMPLVVLDKSGVGSVSNIIKAIDYAVANGADILSMSLGGYCYSQAEEESLWKAFIAGKYIVASAGNDNKDIYTYHPQCIRNHNFPGAFKFVLGIEASQQGGTKALFSNYDNDGPIFSEYDISGPTFVGDYYNYELRAPGVGILSTYLNNAYTAMSGTSMSAPLVAGALSRLLQCRDYSSQENLAGILIQTSNAETGIVDFKAAYEFDELAVDPVLMVTHYNIVDTIAGGNGDGKANPGETLEIYPIIKCIYGQANNISVNLNQGLNVDATTHDILKRKAHVGINLSPGATIQCKEPLIVKISESCGDGYKFYLYPTIECDAETTLDMASAYAHTLEIAIEDKDILSGLLSTEKTLYPDKKHIIDGYYALTDEGVLNIMPGTTILFKNGAALAATRGHIYAVGKPDSMIVFTMLEGESKNISYIQATHKDTIKYAIFRGLKTGDRGLFRNMVLENCIVEACVAAFVTYYPYLFDNCRLYYSNIIDNQMLGTGNAATFMNGVNSYYCNIVNNQLPTGLRFPNEWSPAAWSPGNTPHSCNIFGNVMSDGTPLNAAFDRNQDIIQLRMEDPSYFGSADINEVRKGIWDIHQNQGLGEFVLDNMLTAPALGAHGVVWKVNINDEEINNDYTKATALGVGTHKFDVYYNRPMDISINPTITFGVREPYTQHQVMDNASWSVDSLIYTAYVTLNGRTLTDGPNKLLIKGGQDNDKFAAINEENRFQFLVQAAGSLATGLLAEPGLGKVTLTWHTDAEDFEDLMGYDIYRWSDDTIRWDSHWENGNYIEAGWRVDTTIINDIMLGVNETSYVDYQVTPGKAYYYVIRQINTSLSSYPMSNPVTATPLTSIKGDANGSMSVDVADVITEVNYITNQNPQPFIFEAADVNSDNQVNIIDVVATVNLILHPEASTGAINDGTVYYSIDNGILYVETGVVLGGVQCMFTADAEQTITPLDALQEFEKVSTWQSEDQYLFMAYSMSGKTLGVGKHALLQIGDAELGSIILSDAQGHNIPAAPAVSTALDGTKFVPACSKYLQNGNLYIRLGDHTYGIMGTEIR